LNDFKGVCSNTSSWYTANSPILLFPPNDNPLQHIFYRNERM
jgi:hypothetical protein